MEKNFLVKQSQLIPVGIRTRHESPTQPIQHLAERWVYSQRHDGNRRSDIYGQFEHTQNCKVWTQRSPTCHMCNTWRSRCRRMWTAASSARRNNGLWRPLRGAGAPCACDRQERGLRHEGRPWQTMARAIGTWHHTLRRCMRRTRCMWTKPFGELERNHITLELRLLRAPSFPGCAGLVLTDEDGRQTYTRMRMLPTERMAWNPHVHTKGATWCCLSNRTVVPPAKWWMCIGAFRNMSMECQQPT